MALNKNAKKWVRALRSGKFKQTKSVLRDEKGYCYLGVACELAVQAEIIPPAKTGKGYLTYGYRKDKSFVSLPEKVKKWLGLRTSQGWFAKDKKSLSSMNDHGKTFKQIARTIESEPEGLFAE